MPLPTLVRNRRKNIVLVRFIRFTVDEANKTAVFINYIADKKNNGWPVDMMVCNDIYAFPNRRLRCAYSSHAAHRSRRS